MSLDQSVCVCLCVFFWCAYIMNWFKLIHTFLSFGWSSKFALPPCTVIRSFGSSKFHSRVKSCTNNSGRVSYDKRTYYNIEAHRSRGKFFFMSSLFHQTHDSTAADVVIVIDIARNEQQTTKSVRWKREYKQQQHERQKEWKQEKKNYYKDTNGMNGKDVRTHNFHVRGKKDKTKFRKRNL